MADLLITPDRRRLLAFALCAALLLGAQPLSAVAGNLLQAAPTGCLQPNRQLTLYAEELPRTADGAIRLGYGPAPGQATIPGPLIEMTEGECLAVTLVNDVPEATLAELRDDFRLGSRDPDMPLGVSLHVHGVAYTLDSDGALDTGTFVPPGQSRTFTWFAAPRVADAGAVLSMGTAGYWWYHDHAAGTAHGTGGVGSGLFGGLVVRRPGDLRPDHTYTVAMGDASTINLRRYPDTDTCDPADPQPSATCFVARQGERVEFVVIGIGDEFHTFHLHGHRWAGTRTGLLSSVLDETPLLDNRTVGPGDTFGFTVVAGELVGPGSWMLHCHVQTHSDTGMATHLHVLDRDAALPVHATHGTSS
jgi:manganese oxidase